MKRSTGPLRTIMATREGPNGLEIETLECGHEQQARYGYAGKSDSKRRRCETCTPAPVRWQSIVLSPEEDEAIVWRAVSYLRPKQEGIPQAVYDKALASLIKISREHAKMAEWRSRTAE